MIPASDLEKGQDLQKKTQAEMKISPEECRALADSNAQLPEGSVYAAGMWMPEDATTSATVVTALSAKQQLLASTIERSKSQRGGCTNFTIEVAGQSVETTVTTLDIATSADVETGALISQKMPDGTTMNTVSVEALHGGLLVSVVSVGAAAGKDSGPELAKVVDQVLAAAK